MSDLVKISSLYSSLHSAKKELQKMKTLHGKFVIFCHFCIFLAPYNKACIAYHSNMYCFSSMEHKGA